MSRRLGEPLFISQYCGNQNKKEVHDLDNEKTHCQIDKIIRSGHAVPFNSLQDAHNRGFDNCAYCSGRSKNEILFLGDLQMAKFRVGRTGCVAIRFVDGLFRRLSHQKYKTLFSTAVSRHFLCQFLLNHHFLSVSQ